ncbi:MAG: adenylate/guanylate cyclase domain-containing protein [Alphaproteobacteria bacterium]|nr:adenylate/guanylate cyclase domain-containing protein [Alphaproteobacteria bacterium]
MWRALQAWLFDSAGPQTLPERVRAAIRRQQERSEILIAWVQLAIIGLIATANEASMMPEGVVQFDNVESLALLIYGVFCVLRLVLAYLRLLRPWMLYIAVVADMLLLMGLIFSLHLKYAQSAAFYLKVPTLLYVFLLIALRALRFEARFVLFTGFVAIAGWVLLILYVISGYGGPPRPFTDDFVEYMTSNALLIHAEADKIIAIALTTIVLAVAISRARHLLERAVAEGAAASDLSRFFDPNVASRIRSAVTTVKAGEGELRDATILTVDLRGFTRLSTELAPDDIMKLLQDYQGRICPLIVGNGGSIDKFLGDGILASFGAVAPSSTAAADALRAADAVIEAADRWTAERRATGLPPLSIGLAVAAGQVVFGAVGDGERLEFTVIGDAVNFAAKLEKHNKDEKSRALTDGRTYALAHAQGYISQTTREQRPARQVAGVPESVDIVVLAT